MFNPQDPQALEASFREFARRPENRPVLEAHQQQEVAAALALQEAAAAARLAAHVAALAPADQRLLAPVLRFPAIRQLLMAMTSVADSSSGSEAPPLAAAGLRGPSPLQSLLANPRVFHLLREGARALTSGALTEEQLCAAVQQQAEQARRSEAARSSHQHPPEPAPQQVLLPSHLMVEALNEHLEERRLGNAAYLAQDWGRAHTHYQRALAVVQFVVASTAAEQAEVDANRAAVHLNLAALQLQTREHAAAVRSCDDALAILQPRSGAGGGRTSTSSASGSVDARVAKAWLRRAKANLGLHEHEAALVDCQHAAAADPWSEEVPVLRARVAAARAAAREGVDRQLAVRMLRGL